MCQTGVNCRELTSKSEVWIADEVSAKADAYILRGIDLADDALSFRRIETTGEKDRRLRSPKLNQVIVLPGYGISGVDGIDCTFAGYSGLHEM